MLERQYQKVGGNLAHRIVLISSQQNFTHDCESMVAISLSGKGFEVDEFYCRFVIFEEDSSDMISTIEAALIKINRPLWNSIVDGFGNHTPGSGRFEQAKSDWDVIHPGRAWAEKCNGVAKDKESIVKYIEKHFKDIGK